MVKVGEKIEHRLEFVDGELSQTASAYDENIQFDFTNGISIHVNKNTHVRIIERFVKKAPEIKNLTLHLSGDAVLVHEKYQSLVNDVDFDSQINLIQEENSQYQSVMTYSGARHSSEVINVQFVGQNAECEINALCNAQQDQKMSLTICADHQVGHCKSVQNVRGVVNDKATVEIDSKAIVAKEAGKSEAHQYLRSLLLSKSATANTIPQLEIYNDDVKCSHGATIGQLDEDALFYLTSRGIDEVEAKGMLVDAFVSEIMLASSSRTF